MKRFATVESRVWIKHRTLIRILSAYTLPSCSQSPWSFGLLVPWSLVHGPNDLAQPGPRSIRAMSKWSKRNQREHDQCVTQREMCDTHRFGELRSYPPYIQRLSTHLMKSQSVAILFRRWRFRYCQRLPDTAKRAVASRRYRRIPFELIT